MELGAGLMGWGDAEHGFRGQVPPLDFTLDNTRWLVLKRRAGAVPHAQRGSDVGCFGVQVWLSVPALKCVLLF